MKTSFAKPLRHGFHGLALLLLASFLPADTARAQGEAIGIRDAALAARGFALRAANVEIQGSSLPRDAIETAIRSSDAATLAQRLESLGATSITFTDVNIQQVEGGPNRTIAFGKLVFSGLKAGRIRALQGTNGRWRRGTGVESTFASLRAESVDLGFLMRLAGGTATTGDDSEPLIGSATIERLESNPPGGTRLSIQKISLGDVRVAAGGQRLFPGALGALEFTDIRLSLPPRGADAPATEARVRSIAIGADKPTGDDIPTRYRLRIDALAIPLAPGDKTPYIQNLRGLGLEELALSAALEGNWSEKSREMKLDRLGVDVAKLGSIAFAGAFANVSPEAFTETGAAAQAEWGKALVRRLGVIIRNDGLYERATERYARATGRPVEEIRKSVTLQATETVRQTIGSAPDQTVANAVTQFLANPKTLSVSIAPKAGASLPLSTIFAKGGMQSAAGQYEVTAKAE